ncbi:MAG: glycosyltransferase family 4 protein [Bacteroidota bacterium]
MEDLKRIAFMCHPYHRGGVTRWMADAAVAAAEMGYEVYFVTTTPVKPFHSAGGRETMAGLLQPFTGKVKLVSQPVNFLFEFGTEAYRAGIYRNLVIKQVPAGTPIIVSDDGAVWMAAASVADKYPMAGVLHGDQDYYSERAIKYRDQLSACICVSHRVKGRVLRQWPGFPQRIMEVIPCGVVLPQFNPQQRSDDTARLVFIGRLTDYEKRAEDLVTIAATLRQQGFAFHLDIVGNDEASKVAFTDRFKEHGVADAVTFHGWQARPYIQALLNRSDIVLLTSNSEGMPLVMMEALASGCGFTGTRVSGIEDYEQHAMAQQCVAVYAVGEVADAAKKITQLAAVPRGERQQAVRRLAEAEFSMQVCLQRYLAKLSTMDSVLPAPAVLSTPTRTILQSKLLALARYMKVSVRGK